MINKHRLADLIVLLLLATFVVIYCLDAMLASTDILNLILVLPLSVVVLLLCFVQFIIKEEVSTKLEPITDVLPVAGLFAVYVLTLPWLGFDVGTSLFMAVFLWQQGERRWPWLFGYSIAFAFAMSFFFSAMLPYPMPMLVMSPV